MKETETILRPATDATETEKDALLNRIMEKELVDALGEDLKTTLYAIAYDLVRSGRIHVPAGRKES